MKERRSYDANFLMVSLSNHEALRPESLVLRQAQDEETLLVHEEADVLLPAFKAASSKGAPTPVRFPPPPHFFSSFQWPDLFSASATSRGM